MSMRTMDYTEGSHICMHFLGDICSSQKIRQLMELDKAETQPDVLCTFLGKKEAVRQFAAESNSFSRASV